MAFKKLLPYKVQNISHEYEYLTYNGSTITAAVAGVFFLDNEDCCSDVQLSTLIWTQRATHR